MSEVGLTITEWMERLQNLKDETVDVQDGLGSEDLEAIASRLEKLGAVEKNGRRWRIAQTVVFEKPSY